jgi:two-component system, cell cycle sensor histidine kinase and response regulator CckA
VCKRGMIWKFEGTIYQHGCQFEFMSKPDVIKPGGSLPQWVPTRVGAIRFVLWYLGLGAVWIFGTGWLLHHFVHDHALVAAIENIKCGCFVAATAFLLGLVLNRNFRTIRHAARQLQESERRLRLIGDNLPDSYVYQYAPGPDGKPRFTYVSAGVKRVHGLEPAEVLRDGKCIFEQMDAAQLAGYAAAEAESARNLTDFAVDLQLRRPDGAERVIHAQSRPSRTADGQVQWDGFTVDVTGRKRAEAALRERERQFRLFLEHSPAAIAMLDRDMRYLAVSRRWLADYRLGERDLTGSSHYEVFPEIPNRWKEVHRRCLAGAVEKCEGEAFRRPDGTVDWVRWEIRPWHDDRGMVAGLMIFSEVITARRQAEEALRLSQMKFARVFADNPAAIVLTRLKDGAVVDVNETWLAMTGFRREEVMGRSVRAMWPSTEAAAQFVQELREHGVMRGREQALRKKSGELFVAEYSSQILNIGEEQIILTILVDITERKRAEEATRESDERFRQLAANITDVFWMASPDHLAVHYVSPAYERVWGRSLESLYARPIQWAEAIVPEDREAAIATFAALAGEKTEANLEYRITRPDGVVRWIHDRGFQVRDAAGRLVRLAGIASDITGRKESEREKTRLATALEQTAESIIITDLAGAILYVNPACERITGYTRGELLGQNPRLLKSGKQDAAFYQALWETLGRGEVWHGHLVNRRKDGMLYEEDATISPVRDAGGKVVNFMAIKLDVTREVELEGQFRQAQKLEAIGQLAGGVAHDFNNILAAMLMQVELLATSDHGPGELQTGLDQIRLSAERAANLTRQLLLFSRKQVMQLRVLDLNELVSHLARMLHRIIGEDVQMQLRLHSAPLLTRADAGMLEQVLLNLAVNARDAMPNGGRLLIETAEKQVDAGFAGARPGLTPGRHVWLSVTDTGSGIPREVLPRIFEPFFTTKGAGKGTGLGLATVFGIVKQHRGWIEVISEPAQGANFQIYLPASDAAAPERTAAVAKPDGGTETILLVEDDPAVRAAAQTLLELHGYIVLEAASGDEALEVWEKAGAAVALLLTDLVMPGELSGQQLARKLQSARPELKVIFTSGYSAEIAGKGIELWGGENFVQKPFSPNQLLQTLRRSLDG